MIQQRTPSIPSNVSANETFGRYRLLALLGQGGMGRLYLAERRGIEGFVKIVALKRILPHLADSAQLKEMFLNEARVAARLEHPNICTTYELGEIEGTYFISMEYLPGEDLAATLARCQGEQRMPIDIAAALSQQAAHALHYAHELCDERGRPIELVHRDVNPHNIFVTYHGVAKLLDFGVVRDQKGRKSIPGVFKGKYGYCAPEQLEGGRIDRRTDVFSLGIVLWECLTGSHLFDAGTEAHIIDAVRSRRIEAPSVLRPDVPRALDEIALRALARDPARRYQSAQDLAEDLERFLLEREPRPASKKIGRWMESMFGAERASLKRSLSQGGAAERALERLAELDVIKPPSQAGSGGSALGGSSPGWSNVRPRALWSTNLSAVPGGAPPESPARPSPHASTRITSSPVTDLEGYPPALEPPAGAAEPLPSPGPRAPQSAAPARRRIGAVPLAAGGAVILAIAIGALASGRLSSRSAGTDPGAELVGLAAAALDVRSTPPGADIFVDGSPSGLKTPAVLRSLPTSHSLEIRLDLIGFESTTQKIQLESGQTRALSVALRESAARLHVEHLPAGATVYVDDARVDAQQPVPVTVGTHRVRVEAGGKDLASRSIDVQAGKPAIFDVAAGGSRP